MMAFEIKKFEFGLSHLNVGIWPQPYHNTADKLSIV